MNFMFFANRISLIRLRTWLTLYLTLTIIGVYRHILWRDEMQGWLVALNSQNIFELWNINAPSGHPILYPLLTYISALVYPNPVSMQLMQWLFAAVSAYLFLRYSPFDKLYKILFLFGYFPFWEYCLVSRHYVILELLVFCGAILVTSRKYSIILNSIIIALLFNTHVLGWGIANGFICVSLFIWRQSLNQHRLVSPAKWSWAGTCEILLSFLLVISAAVLSFSSIIQTSREINGSTISIDLHSLLIALGRYLGGSFLIIPNSSRWLDLTIAGVISVFLIVLTALYIRFSTKALLFYAVSLISLLGFNSLVYEGIGSRHFGVYFIILLGSLWIHKADNSRPDLLQKKIYSRRDLKIKFFFGRIFLAILIVHMIAGVHRVFLDYIYPYSASKEVAEFVRNSEYSDWPLFGTRDVELASVSGYLGTSIYYPELGKRGTYAEWKNRISNLRREDTIIYIENYMQKHKDINSMLAIISNNSKINHDFDSGDLKLPDGINIRFVNHFLRSYNKPERYYLYEVRRN